MITVNTFICPLIACGLSVLFRSSSLKNPDCSLSSMKFTAALLFAALVSKSSKAFSAVAPKRGGAVAKGEIDRSMKGVDESGAFDPTTGESPALRRNNNDEVWVEQVCVRSNWRRKLGRCTVASFCVQSSLSLTLYLLSPFACPPLVLHLVAGKLRCC
jgi:hypothetical protein